jgi:amino acid adenylation domain-containing protein
VIHEQFEKMARLQPEAVAVTFEDRSLTYGELDRRSNQLARYLVKLGVGPDVPVGISMERSLDLMVGLLAILKAGGAYLPLDPAYPVRRREMVLEDAQPPVVVTAELVAAAQEESAEPLERRGSPENLAYLIYTSGSTGTPKGVMIEHRNVLNFFTAMDEVLGLREPGVWLAVTSISFDISVLELFWTLARGFHVVLQGGEGVREEEFSIARQIRRYGVTHLQCTPSLARMLAGDRESLAALGELKVLLLGGEALPVTLAEQLREALPAEIHNMYGPTETTIWSTTHRVEEAGGRIPIGRPIANTWTYILDEARQPVPEGAAGELYIGGDGVARGYFKRPELTAERFLADPFRGTGRMYRTGDLCRFRPDGAIEYLERMDFQVKIRGFRIELGEIETAMERYPGVRQAVVAVREEKAGDKRLIGYVVLDPAAAPGAAGLRNHLREQLPEYMTPAAFVRLEAMPLTDNGKIDRKALPAPEGREMPLESVYEAPRKGLEQTIAEVWCEALDVERVSIHDNFFDLGAHSLLVAEVQVKLREVLGKDIPLVAMFRYPTVSLLAGHLSQESEESPRLARSADRARARQQSLERRAVRREAGGV